MQRMGSSDSGTNIDSRSGSNATNAKPVGFGPRAALELVEGSYSGIDHVQL